MANSKMRQGSATAALLTITMVSGAAFAQTGLENTVIPSATVGVITTPGAVVVEPADLTVLPTSPAATVPPLVRGVVVPAQDATLVTATQQVDRVVVQPVDVEQRIIVRPVETGEVVVGGVADTRECYEEGDSPVSDRDRLPPCPAALADLGEIQYVNEPVVQQPVTQVAPVEPVQAAPLDLATVTQGTPCGPGTGTACASNFADLTNVRPFYGTSAPAPVAPPPPPPAPVIAAAPPPPVIAPPPPPVVIPPATPVYAPVPGLGASGLGAGGLLAAGIGAAALAGIIIAVADDDDDDGSSTTTTNGGGGGDAD